MSSWCENFLPCKRRKRHEEAKVKAPDVPITHVAGVDFPEILHAVKAVIVPFLNETDCVVMCQLNHSVKTSVQDCCGDTQQVIAAYELHGQCISLLLLRMMNYFRVHLPAEWLSALTLHMKPNEQSYAEMEIGRPYGKLIITCCMHDHRLSFSVRRYHHTMLTLVATSPQSPSWQCGCFWQTMKQELEYVKCILDLLDNHQDFTYVPPTPTLPQALTPQTPRRSTRRRIPASRFT